MTNEPIINPMAELPPDTAPATLQNHATEMLRNGVPLDSVNAEMTRRGQAAFAPNSIPVLEGAVLGMLHDSEFMDSIAEGNAASLSRLSMAQMALDRAKANADAKAVIPMPEGYIEAVAVGKLGTDAAPEYTTEIGKLASDLHLSPEVARSIIESNIEAISADGNTDPTIRGIQGDEQEKQFLQAVEDMGPGAADRIKSANETLSRARGKSLDLQKIAHSNGSVVAATLLFQAEHLKRTARA